MSAPAPGGRGSAEPGVRRERRRRRRLDLGTPPHVVREIVGHSAIEVTMTIYAHVSLEEKRKALRKLGEALG
jgi:integrase